MNKLYLHLFKKINKINNFWLRGLDLNQGPSGYEPDELPDCSTPRSFFVIYC